ncbi:MAG: 50S ribosomal protein L29 [Spirulinaceae cyanobacterium SM2_1_0]|nr:50S ribosomal protein L29 [Spirulinaceae cyanobacterium SM2_1_0]
MPLSKIADARRLSDEELASEIVAAKRQLFQFRFQRATQAFEKTHEFKHTRHWIAQLLTVERERQLAPTEEPVSATATTSTATTEAEE